MILSRSIIRKTLAEALAYRQFVIKSKTFEDSQIINSYIKGMQSNQDGVSMFEAWGIEKSPQEIVIDFTDDDKLGSYAKKCLKKNDRIYRTKFNQYELS